MKIWFLLALVLASALPAQEVPVRRARDWNSTARDGYCNFRVQVEDEADFLLNGERLTVRSTKGPARDVLTECTGPLPTRDETVRLGRILRGRGNVMLYDAPAARNGWTALIRIMDPQSGPDELEFRLEWGRGEAGSGGGGDSGGGNSASKATRTNGEYDDRDLSKWPTRQIRTEIENIYQQLGRRRPSSDDVDDWIDRVRDKNLTLKDVRRELEGKR